MIHLILLRHAEAEIVGPSDHLRSLTKTGRETATNLGKIFKDKNINPNFILSSDSRRTKDTLKLLDIAGSDELIAYSSEVYTANNADALVKLLTSSSITQRLSGKEVLLLVGHNPAISELVEKLSGNFTSLEPGEACYLTHDSADWTTGLYQEGEWKQSMDIFNND